MKRYTMIAVTQFTRQITLDRALAILPAESGHGAAPQAFAACRNLAIALLRRRGHATIAEALRTHAGRPRDAVTLVTSGGRP